MRNRIRITVDGETLDVEEGVPVAVALANAGRSALRQSATGERRGVLCAMGVCYECRVTIDGRPHRRACLELCSEGMEVRTGE